MIIIENPDRKDWAKICQRPSQNTTEIEARVRPILEEVKVNGDTSLRALALQYDNVMLNEIQMPQHLIEECEANISSELKLSIDTAYKNIYTFHKAQISTPQIIETSPGVHCWRKSVGIDHVGLYIPGGTAPLFSTVLMLGIPAKIAGCKRVVLCTPSTHPAILYAAKICGITEIYRLGGAQAIAAMAYGTESIQKVYKIFGPGNQYVTVAKMLVNVEGTAIDMPAGPSEVAVYADETAIPQFVAADLLSQAEHGTDSQVVLVSNSKNLIDQVLPEIVTQTDVLPRAELIKETLKNSRFIYFSEETTAIEFLNEYAAEHLILACDHAEAIEHSITNAGSIFLGNYTPEAAGDYASGTNHTLPTNGYAKAYSGVSVDSFVKKITVQKISKEGINTLGPYIEHMAEAEALAAHKNAITVRLNYK